MLRTVYGDPQRYIDQYWSEYAEQGWYLAGDSARKDEDGYIWIIGRIDDVHPGQRLSIRHRRNRERPRQPPGGRRSGRDRRAG